MMAVALAVSDKVEDKIRFCFRCLDQDGNMKLNKQEVLYAVELLFANRPALYKNVSPTLNTPDKVVEAIFNLVDKDKDENLDVEELIQSSQTEEFNKLGLKHIFLS